MTMIVNLKTNHKKPQKGAALITVLVIVFIVMAIISNITVKNYRVIKQLSNQNISEQSYSILAMAVNFGRAGLATSASTSKIDTLTDLWAQPIPRTEVLENIDMSGYLIDEQGKFNINDLVQNGAPNQKTISQFSKLLTYLNLPTGLSSNIAYYMAAPQNQSEIVSQYTMGNPPYRPAGRPIIDLSELVLIKGMQPELVYKLSKYITAIPPQIGQYTLESNTQESNSSESNESAPTQSTSESQMSQFSSGLPVNINTASAEVIAAKSGMPLSVAQRVATTRNTAPFNNQQDIQKFLTNNGIILSQNGANSSSSSQSVDISTLTTKSSYFTVHAIVNSGNYEFKWIALVHRLNRSGQWPTVLWQHPE